MKLPIKPLSVNQAWQGKRFKTKEYDGYIRDVCLLLPNKIDIPDGPLKVWIVWGFSSKASDVDNPAKCFIDCLQKKYHFNDSRIYKLTMTKEIVKKGKEYIEFHIQQY